MYNLDFETIKLVMQEHQKTGFLYAEIPSGTARLRESCRIEIEIMTGSFVFCTLIGNSGRRLTGKEAEKELSRLGRLSWTFTPRQEATLPQSTAPVPALLKLPIFPRRIARLEQWQMRNWSRMHWAVFALVDGTKSSTKIAEMLSVPSDQVEKALRDLQSIGVIAL
jgi:hypothetical protein